MSDIPKVAYLDAGRELCVTGACLLTASESALGHAIRFFEGGGAVASHAAAVVRYPASLVARDRVTLIESLEHGPTSTYLSHYFSGFTGRLFLFVPDGLTPDKQTAFAACCLDKVHQQVKYDYAAIGAQILGHVKEDGGALFCSELVGLAWEAAGIARATEYQSDLAPQPSDIPVWWKGVLYELVGPFAREAA